MTNYSKLFEKIKIDILKHIESNTQELSPSQRRCVNEVFYGNYSIRKHNSFMYSPQQKFFLLLRLIIKASMTSMKIFGEN